MQTGRSIKMVRLNRKSQNIITVEKLILVLTIFYPLLFIWQGLDFTDTGFVLTNYQQIFINPDSIESTFRIWLSSILGGLWLYFFGDTLGLLGYRMAAVLLVYGTLYFSFLILRPHIRTKPLLFGLLLALIFVNRSGFSFNYNSLTAFFYVLAVFFFGQGAERKSEPLIVYLRLCAGS